MPLVISPWQARGRHAGKHQRNRWRPFLDSPALRLPGLRSWASRHKPHGTACLRWWTRRGNGPATGDVGQGGGSWTIGSALPSLRQPAPPTTTMSQSLAERRHSRGGEGDGCRGGGGLGHKGETSDADTHTRHSAKQVNCRLYTEYTSQGVGRGAGGGSHRYCTWHCCTQRIEASETKTETESVHSPRSKKCPQPRAPSTRATPLTASPPRPIMSQITTAPDDNLGSYLPSPLPLPLPLPLSTCRRAYCPALAPILPRPLPKGGCR